MCPKIKRDMEDVMILCCFQYFERSSVTVFFEVLPSALSTGVHAGFAEYNTMYNKMFCGVPGVEYTLSLPAASNNVFCLQLP
jgi:hypothetical protein